MSPAKNESAQKSDGTVCWVDDSFCPLSTGTTSGSMTKDFVFLGNKRFAFVSLASGNAYYYLSDHLGSTAVIGSGDGKTIQWEADYFPFGTERQVFTNLVNNSYQFTGYERDSGTGETGLDYANFRYYGSGQGRFMSADLMGGQLRVPRSLNRYAYVGNDPINLSDPMGLFWFETTACVITDSASTCETSWDWVDLGEGGGGGGGDLGGGGGGDGGGGDGGKPTKLNIEGAVGQCALDMFGVIMTQFTFSVGTGNPGTNVNGQFSGLGLDMFKLGTDITVTNDIQSKDRDAVNANNKSNYNNPNAAGVTDGYTTFRNPYVNYTANDVTGSAAISVQIFELGNSLNYITTGKPLGRLDSPADDPGAKFAQCVINALKVLK